MTAGGIGLWTVGDTCCLRNSEGPRLHTKRVKPCRVGDVEHVPTPAAELYLCTRCRCVTDVSCPPQSYGRELYAVGSAPACCYAWPFFARRTAKFVGRAFDCLKACSLR